MNSCLASAIALIALSIISAFASQNAPDQPKFEVASVKRAERCDFKTSIDPGVMGHNLCPRSGQFFSQ